MKNKRYLWLLMFALSILFCYQCSEEPFVDVPDEIPIDPIIPTGNEKYLTGESDYIFDQDRLPTFELTLSPSALGYLDNDPTEEEYVEGSLTFEGETISPVGIRYKGSVGAFVGCVSGADWANPSGRKTCTKLSMKVKINWLDSDDKFYNVKKLQFHSMNLDDSQMRERLGYYLFRKMGVPAPRSVHARLMINGRYSGVYALVEQIDGRFTRQNFDNGKGNLYKEIWPLRENGRPYSESEYLKSLKTNEDENPTAEMIRSFGQEIADAQEDNLQDVIARWMDLDEIMAFAAVDRTIRADDGPFHWYCSSQCTNHNYYWYEEPSSRIMHLIPWDLDNSFENIVYDQNPVTPIADDWGETRQSCTPFTYGAFNLQQRSAACDKLTAGWASFTEEYQENRQELISGPMSAENINILLEQWSAQIYNATQEADNMHSDALGVSSWQSAVDDMKRSLEYARNN